MSVIVSIHSDNPQARFISRVADVLEKGGVAIYPTDSGYALGCLLGQKEALDRIHVIRQLPKEHLFTLLCRDLSHISNYAQIDNPLFRYLKAHTPGPFTFLLKATKEVPKRLLHPKRKTIGVRVPDNAIAQALLNMLSQPLMNVSLLAPGPTDQVINEVDEIPGWMHKQVDIVIDAGYFVAAPTTVIDLTSGEPLVIRKGQAADEA